jgi:alpha-N-arabinofuranosidase
MEPLISRHLEIMDQHDKHHRVGLMVDEYGTWYDVEPGTNPGFLYQQNTLRDAIAAAINLNIFNNHADRVKMANIAQTINVLQAMILTRKEQMVLTPTYHVFRMFKVHQNAKLVPSSLTCQNYTFEGKSVPGLSASASKDSKGRVHVTVANLDPKSSSDLTIDLGTDKTAEVSGEVITATAMNDFNDFGTAPKVAPVKFNQFKRDGNRLLVTLPAKSVVALELAFQ